MKKQNMEEDYFSVHNLDKLAEIDGHMSFIEELIEKYSRMSQDVVQTGDVGCDWNLIQEQLRLIRKKMNEKKLNISVIGEFSTGKSTFINALLRKELLASSALQGTTVASTVIDYDSQYRIHLEYLDGRKDQKLTYPAFAELKDDLDRYTTEPAVAKLLKTVRVYLPSEILKHNFRIIDTPGTNVTEAWHEDVTVRTLKNDSDLSIILISAEKPAPETMLKFVEKNLTSILPQCVFVVTKLDLIQKRERVQQLSYVKMKLEEELGLKDAVVLPYISPLVLDSQVSDSERYVKQRNTKDLTQMMEIDSEQGTRESIPVDEELLELSLETEHKLVEHTVKQRTLAITKKLAALIDDMYISISRKMEQISDAYEKRLKLLNRSSKTDLSIFVRQEKSDRLRHFDEASKKVLDDMEEKLSSAADSAKKEILGKLDEKGSIDLMKTYISNMLGSDCSQWAETMLSEMDRYYGQIRKQFKKEMDIYNKAFKKNYETLNIMPIDMAQSKYNLPEDIEIETANISSTANYIAEKLSSENMAFWGGAAAGAVAGTAIAPGIGTLIGGLIGFFAGGSLAPDVNAVRKQCKDKLRPQLTSYYGSICNKLTSALEQYTKQIRQCLNDEIDGYLARYKREVERLIAEENNQKSVVQSKIQELDTDRNQIRNRKNQLESVMLQLNYFGRKEN